MSVYLNDVANSVRAGMVAAMPSLRVSNGGGGVHEVENIGTISYEEVVKTLPYAAFQLSTATPDDGEFGSCNKYFRTDLEMVVVMEANSNNDNVRPSIEEIRDRFLNTGIDNALVLDVSEVDCSETAGANRIFIAKGDTQRCGTVKANLLFGDDADGA